MKLLSLIMLLAATAEAIDINKGKGFIGGVNGHKRCYPNCSSSSSSSSDDGSDTEVHMYATNQTDGNGTNSSNSTNGTLVQM